MLQKYIAFIVQVSTHTTKNVWTLDIFTNVHILQLCTLVTNFQTLEKTITTCMWHNGPMSTLHHVTNLCPTSRLYHVTIWLHSNICWCGITDWSMKWIWSYASGIVAFLQKTPLKSLTNTCLRSNTNIARVCYISKWTTCSFRTMLSETCTWRACCVRCMFTNECLSVGTTFPSIPFQSPGGNMSRKNIQTSYFPSTM